VIKWLLVMVAVVLLLGWFAPQLARLGLWRLPGDLRFRHKGRDYHLPITSTLLISLLLTLMLRMLRI
jgi:multisubunit Na+/H+ antiporter MnhG subunit